MIFCIECQSDVEAAHIQGVDAYPHRPDLARKNFWQCPSCKNFVGTHKNGDSMTPLGCIPNRKMKSIRMQIHSVIDPIWKTRKLSRSEVYKRISEKIGYEYHTGEIKSIPEANRIFVLVQEMARGLG